MHRVIGILMVVFASLGLADSALTLLSAASERNRARPANPQAGLLELVSYGDPRAVQRRQKVRWLDGLSGVPVSALHLAIGLFLLAGRYRKPWLPVGFTVLAVSRALIVISLTQVWLLDLHGGGIIGVDTQRFRWRVTGFAAASLVWGVVSLCLLQRSTRGDASDGAHRPGEPGAA